MSRHQEEVQQLRAEVEELRVQVRHLRDQGTRSGGTPDAQPGRVSRGGLLRAAGAAAAGAAAASVLGPSIPVAQAANGASVVLGQDNTATGVTSLSGAVLGDAALRVTNFYANGSTTPPSPGQIDDYSDAFQAYTFGAGLSAVYGRNDASGGSGVNGYSGSGVGGQFSGGFAPLYLQPAGTTGAPTSTNHQAGEIVVDAAGAFWICTASGTSSTPGTFKQIGTTDQGLHSFPTPRRVFGDGTTIASGTTTAAIDATAGNSGVPVGAQAAYCAVQVNPGGTGPLTLFPDGTTDPGVGNYTAIVPNVLNLFYMLVPLSSAGKFKIHTYVSGQIYVDVWGYLR